MKYFRFSSDFLPWINDLFTTDTPREDRRGEGDMTLTSYPSSWSLTSQSPLINKKRLTRSDSAGSLPDNILDKRDAKGRTTFFNATKVGDLEEAKRLFSAGSDVNKGDIYRITPLHEAVERSNLEVVEFLIAKGIYHQC